MSTISKLRDLVPPQSSGQLIAMSPDYRTILIETSTTHGRCLIIIDVETWKKTPPITCPEDAMLSPAEFSPNGDVLAITRCMGQFEIRETKTGRIRAKSLGHPGRITSFSFRVDGKVLATSSADGKTRISDVLTGKCLAVISHFNECLVCRFIPAVDARAIYNVRPWRKIAEVAAQAQPVVFDVSECVSAYNVSDPKRVKQLWKVQLQTDLYEEPSVSADGSLVLVPTGPGACYELIETTRGEVVRQYPLGDGVAYLSPDGQYVVVMHIAEREARVYRRSELLGRLPSVLEVEFAPSSLWLMAREMASGRMRFFSLPSLAELASIDAPYGGQTQTRVRVIADHLLLVNHSELWQLPLRFVRDVSPRSRFSHRMCLLCCVVA